MFHVTLHSQYDVVVSSLDSHVKSDTRGGEFGNFCRSISIDDDSVELITDLVFVFAFTCDFEPFMFNCYSFVRVPLSFGALKFHFIPCPPSTSLPSIELENPSNYVTLLEQSHLSFYFVHPQAPLHLFGLAVYCSLRIIGLSQFTDQSSVRRTARLRTMTGSHADLAVFMS